MNAEALMRCRIQAALLGGHEDGYEAAPLTYVGDVAHTRNTAVTELALAAMSAAVQAAQALAHHHFGRAFPATLYRDLVDDWCFISFIPQGWDVPDKWDGLSNDFPTRDGWIRLHTNYPHLRAVTSRVLGGATTRQEAADFIRDWNAEELQEAIVAAGSCAAAWNPTDLWRVHPQGRAVAEEPIVHWSDREAAGPAWQAIDPVRPLRGLKVLDLTRVLAGPASTRFLASLGASVLRIDPKGWIEGQNEIEMTAGKHCATLDLKSDAGRGKLLALAAEAHVFVNGYRADALEGLGLDEDTLRRVNPNLTIVYLNAFGWTGPWRNRRGFDSLVQRCTGLAIQGPDGKPQGLPYQVLDHATGYLCAAAALHGLRRTASHGIASTARLSLARQAHILLENLDSLPTSTVPATPEQKARRTTHEETPWGPLERLPLPFEIEGIAAGWSIPAHTLRSDPVAWPEDTFTAS